MTKVNMEPKNEMMVAEQDANEESKTVSEVDVPMSSEIEKKSINAKN